MTKEEILAKRHPEGTKLKKLTIIMGLLLVLCLLVPVSCASAPPAPMPAPTPPPPEIVMPPQPATAPAPPEEEVSPAEEEESTMPILTDGTHRWRLKATTFGEREVEFGSQVRETSEGWVVLQAEFENLSGVSLIKAWYQETKGGETSMIETFSIEGIANVYVTDSQGSMYPAVVLSAASWITTPPLKNQITFVVPSDGHGFTLYFLDCAPIELGY